jgi:hypothetical protein
MINLFYKCEIGIHGSEFIRNAIFTNNYLHLYWMTHEQYLTTMMSNNSLNSYFWPFLYSDFLLLKKQNYQEFVWIIDIFRIDPQFWLGNVCRHPKRVEKPCRGVTHFGVDTIFFIPLDLCYSFPLLQTFKWLSI